MGEIKRANTVKADETEIALKNAFRAVTVLCSQLQFVLEKDETNDEIKSLRDSSFQIEEDLRRYLNHLSILR